MEQSSEEIESSGFNVDRRNMKLEALRLLTIASSLISFSCIASIQFYASSSALSLGVVAGVLVWLWNCAMFGVELSMDSMHACSVSEAGLKRITLLGDVSSIL